MQRAVILTEDEYAAIPANAASILHEAMKYAGLKLVCDGDDAAFERSRDWMCGILVCQLNQIVVPWKQSRFNDAQSQPQAGSGRS